MLRSLVTISLIGVVLVAGTTTTSTAAEVQLVWTAPGDDGSVGSASEYDIRWAMSPISEANWAAASQLDGEPSPGAPGAQEIFLVSSLQPNTQYYFAVKTGDDDGNWSSLSNVAVVLTPNEDTEAPQITGVNVLDVDATTARVVWTTDEPATSCVAYDSTGALGDTTETAFLVQSHSLTLNDLAPGTGYLVRAGSRDAAGNESFSAVYSFATSPADVNGPVISNVRLAAVTQKKVTVAWDTDEPATTYIQYGLDSSLTMATTIGPQLVIDHSCIVKQLDANTTYFYRVVSADPFANESSSGIRMFITAYGNLDNVAKGKPVRSDGDAPGHNRVAVTDTIIDPYADSATWASEDNMSSDHWVEIDFEAVKTVDAVVVYWAWDTVAADWATAQSLMLQRWNGSTFENMQAVAPPEAGSVTLVPTGGVAMSMLRVVQPAGQGPTAHPGTMWLAEVEAYGTAGLSLDIDDDDPSGLPDNFALAQNYPNPFNPTTMIEYSLASAEAVRLDVFNLLGQTVTTLVDEHQAAGTHVVEWDGLDAGGRDVASGVYFYRLTAGAFSEVKKMIMVQ